MFVTETLRQEINQIFTEMEPAMNWLEKAQMDPSHSLQSEESIWVAERLLHVSTERMTDAGNLVIDALVMRDPGGYPDIIRVLMEEEAVTREWFDQFEGCLLFRDKLVHQYRKLTASDVRTAVENYGALFRPYVDMMRRYLGIN